MAARTRPEQWTVQDLFYCRAKKRKVRFGECLERFVDANAFDDKRSACWRCFQGRKYREEFSLR